jgi:hypothetical protein
MAASFAVLVLVALALLTLGLSDRSPLRDAGHLTAVDLPPAPQGERAKPLKAEHQLNHAKAAPHPPVPQPNPEPQSQPVVAPPSYIRLSREEFAASDISKMSHGSPAQSDSGNARSSYGPGQGPGGAHLYNAKWYREPSQAEIGPYVDGHAPPGAWAVIACQTVEHYHVENCQELEESPMGSGLARGLRRAAWQFLVWPPRIDGQPQLGTWVRIRFDFTRATRSDDAGGGR